MNDLRKKLDTLHQLDSEKTHELEKLNKLYKKKDGISNLEKAIEYINIEIKRKNGRNILVVNRVVIMKNLKM